MSSVSWDRTPTRRASAETASCCARMALSLRRASRLDGGDAAGSQREDEEHRRTAEHDAEPTDQPGLRAGVLGSAALLGVGGLAGGVEERLLGVGEGGLGARLPVQHPGQPDAAVELAGRAPEGVPGVGRAAEVVPDALALDVVVEPAAEPGPGPGQCLVGDLEDALVAGHQARREQGLDQGSSWASARPAVAAHGCGRLRPRRRGRPAAGRGRAAGVARSGSSCRRAARRTGRRRRGCRRRRGSRRRSGCCPRGAATSPAGRATAVAVRPGRRAPPGRGGRRGRAGGPGPACSAGPVTACAQGRPRRARRRGAARARPAG